MCVAKSVAWLAGGALIFALTGCAREPSQPQAAAADASTRAQAPAIDVPSLDAGDFRGFRWGDPMATVLATEAKRSTRIGDFWEFSTELSGLPATVGYGASSDQLVAGWYVFASPAESALCGAGVAVEGSECSLTTAAYAMAACARMAEQLDRQYGSSARPSSRDGVLLAPSRPEELDQLLKSEDSGVDTVPRNWTHARVRAFEAYVRPRKVGEGWRCLIRYYPSAAIAGERAG